MSFRQALAEYIEVQAKPREKFGHQPRLYALTLEIGRGMEYDDDVVYAAVWLHDLGVFTGHRPEDLEELKRWNNTKYAMEKTPGLLEGMGFPADKIPAVVEAIRTHSRFADFTSVTGSLRQALADLPPKIKLPKTQELARPRIHALTVFLASVDAEAGPLLY